MEIIDYSINYIHILVIQDSADFFSLRLIQAYTEIPVNSNTDAIASIWNSATFYEN